MTQRRQRRQGRLWVPHVYTPLASRGVEPPFRAASHPSRVTKPLCPNPPKLALLGFPGTVIQVSPERIRMTELIWDGKYKDDKKQGPVRIALPFQTIETVNESAQDRRRNLELFASGRDTEWRNRLIWGDNKYVLSSLLPEFAGKVNLIYIDPPFDTGADFSFTSTIPDHSELDEDEETPFTKEASSKEG